MFCIDLQKRAAEYFEEKLRELRQIRRWSKSDYLENAPQVVKEKVLRRYGILDSTWVETGTFRGTTTDFLAKHSLKVYTIEPAEELYKAAVRRFKDRNIEVINDTSENVFPKLLPKLGGSISFWQDGHFSSGETFKGDKDSPVEEELSAISDNIHRFDQVAILIDDVRCFLPANTQYKSYPSIDFLVDWSRQHEFDWRIEHDIFIMQNLKTLSSSK